MARLALQSGGRIPVAAYYQVGRSEEYRQIEEKTVDAIVKNSSHSSQSKIWSYLLVREVDSDADFSRKLSHLIDLLEDGYEIFNGADFNILVKILASKRPIHLSILFDLLQAMVLSPVYQSRMFSIIESTLLYSGEPEVRYMALELLSEELNSEEVRAIFQRARVPFLNEKTNFVKDYFQELYSSLAS